MALLRLLTQTEHWLMLDLRFLKLFLPLAKQLG